jgi:hypothetical protein
MLEIGKINQLEVVKKVDFGLYLQAGDKEILLPKRYIPQDTDIGDRIDVFIYLDSEDRIIATTEIPLAQVGSTAHLEVVSTGIFGAFLDWNIAKDLLVPFKEQLTPMHQGRKYTVYVYVDITGRIAASSKLDKFLTDKDEDGLFVEGQQVDIRIASRSDIGYKVIINNTHLGVVHNSDILSKLYLGDTKHAYIKKIRDDKKIDVILQPLGLEAVDLTALKIISLMENNAGSLDITDRSPADVIFKKFGVSKTIYKKTLGKLYKQNKIIVDKDKIKLVKIKL